MKIKYNFFYINYWWKSNATGIWFWI